MYSQFMMHGQKNIKFYSVVFATRSRWERDHWQLSGEGSIIIKIISYIRHEYSITKVGVIMDQWSGWAVGIGRHGVF